MKDPIILAPVDFSPVSLNAARYAAHLGALLNHTVHLLNVVQLPVVYGDIPMPIGNYDQLVEQAREELALLAGSLEKELHGQVTIHMDVKVGSPVHEILALAERKKPYVTVVGTRGLGSVDRFLLGSVTLSVVRECAVPVLVIPENYAFRRPRKIGLACDMDHVVERTPDAPIRRLVEDLDAHLLIIHNNPHYAEYEPAVMEEAMWLDTMFDKQRHSFHFLHSGYTEESILEFAGQNELDMLIVVPQKHGLLDSIFGHRHTREFVLHAGLPVVVIRHDCSTN